jgi:hypothetical protein
MSYSIEAQYRDASIIGGISKRTALAPNSLWQEPRGFGNWYVFHNVNADGNTAAT